MRRIQVKAFPGGLVVGQVFIGGAGFNFERPRRLREGPEQDGQRRPAQDPSHVGSLTRQGAEGIRTTPTNSGVFTIAERPAPDDKDPVTLIIELPQYRPS